VAIPKTTEVLIIQTPKQGVTPQQIMAVIPSEIRATVKLYLDGKIRQWYSRGDGNGVIFLVDAKTEDEARAITTRNRPLMNYPYATFYLETQRARRNLLHVFKAEPEVPAAGPVLPAAKCAPAQAMKRKADSRWTICQNCLGIHVNSFAMRREI
jgi:hypothetical protein